MPTVAPNTDVKKQEKGIDIAPLIHEFIMGLPIVALDTFEVSLRVGADNPIIRKIIAEVLTEKLKRLIM